MDNKQPTTSQTFSLEQLRQKALTLHKDGDLKQAVAIYKALLKHNPNDTGAWINLGVAYRLQKRYHSSANCYIRALAIKPNDLSAMGNLANTYKDLRRFDEAIALHRMVVSCQPKNVSSLMNYAVALREQGQFAEALVQLDGALMLDPTNSQIEWERAQNLLYVNNYTQGFRAYEARCRTGDLPAVNIECPMWMGALAMSVDELTKYSSRQLLERFKQELNGKTILLHTEQGYGDTILAARYVALVKQMVGDHGTVILQCKPALHRLFKCIGADLIITPDKMLSQTLDFHCSLMSLMGAFYTQPNTIPPPALLTIPEESKKKFSFLAKTATDKKIKKIGIVWSGSVTFKNNDRRRLPLETFLPLANQSNVRVYSLQKDEPIKELYATGADAYILDVGALCEDFADTAAAIEHLDVIVMTDSSVAHLASSLGKRVINILNEVPYWLYMLDLPRTPWYPTMECVQHHQLNLLPQLIHQSITALLHNHEQVVGDDWKIKTPDAVVMDTGTLKERGVYALRAFAKNEVIECTPVLIFGATAEETPEVMRKYVFCWTSLTKDINNKNQQAIALGSGSLYNHANPANMRYEANADKKLLRFVAQRDINAHEELTINYSALGGVAVWPNENWFERMQVDIIG